MLQTINQTATDHKHAVRRMCDQVTSFTTDRAPSAHHTPAAEAAAYYVTAEALANLATPGTSGGHERVNLVATPGGSRDRL